MYLYLLLFVAFNIVFIIPAKNKHCSDCECSDKDCDCKNVVVVIMIVVGSVFAVVNVSIVVYFLNKLSASLMNFCLVLFYL